MRRPKISVTKHAINRAIQHFRIDRRVAEEWVRSQFRKATFISEIISDDGKPTKLYAFNRIAFAVVDADAGAANLIVTVYPQNHAVNDIAERVRKLTERELRKAERKERSVSRQVSVEKAKLTVERARCEYNMIITPSRAVIEANKKRIAEIDEKMANLDRMLNEAQREKSAVAKSMVAYL